MKSNPSEYPPLDPHGITLTDTVMLDLDDVSFKSARYWARRTMRFFDLWGFIILKSNKDHYHAVFDRAVTWSENMSIVSSVVINSRNLGLQRWFNQQCRKIGSTLRVGPKGDKPSPRIVYRARARTNSVKMAPFSNKSITKDKTINKFL